MGICQFVVTQSKETNHYLCGVTNSFCGFQRWGRVKQGVVNTDNFVHCKVRRDKLEDLEVDFIPEEVSIIPEKELVEEKPKKQKAKKEVSKNKFLVVLACPKYIIIKDENGHNKQMTGNYGVNKGDYIEV
jgi:hypothetical protein